MSVTIVHPGAFATVQDLGRFGQLAFGVGIAGSFDRRAAALANRLVGNPESAALLEALAGGLTLTPSRAIVASVTGARGPVFLNEQHVGRALPLVLRPGDVLRVGQPAEGIRSYLAVAGGIVTETVLGSASRDTLAELGPAPVASGDVYSIGAAVGDVPSVDVTVERRISSELLVTPGPHAAYFSDDALATLLTHQYEVSSASNRIGVRFAGTSLRRVPDRELPSTPMIRGSIQVPPDGQPVMLGPDHPVTGGYPVIAVVTDHSVDDAAQLTPGLHVRFRLT